MADKEYKALQKAETGGEKNPWIRTKVQPPGGSTAYGPVQITMGKAIDYVNRADQTGMSPESVKFFNDVMRPMYESFKKYGKEPNKPGYKPEYDYGGTGFFKEEHKVSYEKFANEMIRYDLNKVGGNQEAFLKVWRGQEPEKRYKDSYMEEYKNLQFPKQSRLDELMSFINPMQIATAEAGEIEAPKTGRLDDMTAWDKFLTSNIGSKVVDILTGGMTLTEAEALQRQEIQSIVNLPGQVAAVGKLVLKEILPRTMPTMTMLSSLIPEITKDDIDNIAQYMGTISKPMGRPFGAVQEGVGATLTGESVEDIAKETIKGFLKPEKSEPIQRQLNPVKAGESNLSIGIRAVGEAFETLALSSVIYGGGITKLRDSIRLAGQKNTLSVVEKDVVPVLEKNGIVFPGGLTPEDKAIITVQAAKDSVSVSKLIQRALVNQQVSFIRSESGAIRAIGVGDYVKAGKKIAKVVRLEGTKAILSVAGKELSKNVAELEVIPSEYEAASQKPPLPPKPTAVSPEAKTALDLFKDKSGNVATGMDDAEEFVSKTFVPLSTRLSKIDESLKHKLRKHEFDIGIQNKKDVEKVVPFLKKIKELPKATQDELDIALKNANPEEIDTLLKQHNLTTEHQSIRAVLDDIYKRAKDSGMDIKYLDTYFPRKVNDLEGLLDYFANSSQWSMIKKAFDKEAGSLGRPLQDEEKAMIISSMIRGFGKNKITFGSAGHTKSRSVQEITPEINKFYKPAIPTLIDYIQGMNTNIAVRNFFGKGKNLEISIGNYVSKLIDQGVISSHNEKELTDVLRAYFTARGTHGIVTTFKNFSYMASMGSPISAITQIQDLAFSLYKNGYYNSWMGAKHKLVTKEALGIENIADEFTDPSKSSKALTKLFKVIGLDAMDAFGKETLINGALFRIQKAAEKNDPKLLKMLDDAFGKDSKKVLNDFLNKEITDDVKYILFSELADFQPIALSEMPEYYAKGGNMRIFYMLKSYTIKQLDAYHNEIFRNMKKNPAESIKNLIKLTTALAVLGVTADTIKDMLLGRKTKLQDLVVDNMLRLVGFSKWQIYKSKQDGFFETLLSSILPPIPFVDDMWKDFVSLADKKKTVSQLRVWQRLPVVGKFYYWWFGGGKDIKKKDKKLIIK